MMGVLATVYIVGAGGVLFIADRCIWPWRKAFGIALLWPAFVVKAIFFALADGLEALFGSAA